MNRILTFTLICAFSVTMAYAGSKGKVAQRYEYGKKTGFHYAVVLPE